MMNGQMLSCSHAVHLLPGGPRILIHPQTPPDRQEYRSWPECRILPVLQVLRSLLAQDGSGGRGWTERSEGNPGVSSYRSPTPATHQSMNDRAPAPCWHQPSNAPPWHFGRMNRAFGARLTAPPPLVPFKQLSSAIFDRRPRGMPDQESLA